jgi:cellulose synthase/poly-beta-1,6-N-acetylglucosamine synthase-like glycosyltransferase
MLLLLGKMWKQKPNEFAEKKGSELVTVLIPFRNEGANIPVIFHQITSLSYRPLQVVWINDHSDDGGRKLLEALIRNHDEELLDFVLADNEGEGKKAALKTGIDNAFGSIVMTTDADCFLPTDWVEVMLKPFADDKTKMVAGPILTKGNDGFFQNFQQIEWASILLVTKAGFYLQSPIMCSAANMAYRKSAFLEVDGYQGNENLLSGDDEFLLKKMVKKFGPESIVYQKENLVYTQPQTTWKNLFYQRFRWASKWKAHQSLTHTFASVLPVAVQIFFLGSLSLLFAGNPGMLVFAAVWILKIYFENLTLGNVLRGYGVRPHFIWFLSTGIFHPIYVLICGIGALFVKFEWKGRYSSGKG